MGSIASSLGTSDPITKVGGELVSFIQEITTAAHKLVMEDLKPFLREELQACVADATKYLFEAQSTVTAQPDISTPSDSLEVP